MRKPIGIGIALATACLASQTMAQTTHNPGTGAPQAGWSAGSHKGLSFSDGENFMVNIKNLMQIQYIYGLRDEDGTKDTNTFNARRLRTAVSGTVFDDRLTFKLQNEWGSNVSIKDAWMKWRCYESEDYSCDVAIGQMKSNFGREFNLSGGSLDFVDRGLAVMTFSNSRTWGAQATGHAMENQLMWSLGAFNQDVAGASIRAAEEAANDDNELNFTGMVQYSNQPKNVGMGQSSGGDLANTEELGWAAGAGFWSGNQGSNVSGTPDTEVMSYWIFVEVRTGGIAGNAEYFARNEEVDATGGVDGDSTGFQIGASWTQPENGDTTHRFGFGARYAMVTLDDPHAGLLLRNTGLGNFEGDATSIELVGTLFQSGNHGFKHQLGLAFVGTDGDGVGAPDSDDVVLTWQSSLIF